MESTLCFPLSTRLPSYQPESSMKIVHCPALPWGNYWLLIDVEGRFLQQVPSGEPTNLHSTSITMVKCVCSQKKRKRHQGGKVSCREGKGLTIVTVKIKWRGKWNSPICEWNCQKNISIRKTRKTYFGAHPLSVWHFLMTAHFALKWQSSWLRQGALGPPAALLN